MQQIHQQYSNYMDSRQILKDSEPFEAHGLKFDQIFQNKVTESLRSIQIRTKSCFRLWSGVSLSKSLGKTARGFIWSLESWLQYPNLNLLNWRICSSFRHHTDILEKCMSYSLLCNGFLRDSVAHIKIRPMKIDWIHSKICIIRFHVVAEQLYSPNFMLMDEIDMNVWKSTKRWYPGH